VLWRLDHEILKNFKRRRRRRTWVPHTLIETGFDRALHVIDWLPRLAVAQLCFQKLACIWHSYSKLDLRKASGEKNHAKTEQKIYKVARRQKYRPQRQQKRAESAMSIFKVDVSGVHSASTHALPFAKRCDELAHYRSCWGDAIHEVGRALQELLHVRTQLRVLI